MAKKNTKSAYKKREMTRSPRTSKYFSASAPKLYLQLNESACDNFDIEGRDHPYCNVHTRATLEMVQAQADIVDAGDATPAECLFNSFKQTSILIREMGGDFSYYAEPFEMEWPDIEEDDCLDRRAAILCKLTLIDFTLIQTACVESVRPTATEKNSDGD